MQEFQVNIISEGCKLEGVVLLDQFSRVYGFIKGELHGTDGSTIILCSTATVQGDIFCDQITVDGFVEGNIIARRQIKISGQGRVTGNIKAPSLVIETGAYLEGACQMDGVVS